MSYTYYKLFYIASSLNLLWIVLLKSQIYIKKIQLIMVHIIWIKGTINVFELVQTIVW
jgi:hypothetical protein